MGGRGSVSGLQSKTIGFTFYRDGKENLIEKVDSNHVLLNGDLVK